MGAKTDLEEYLRITAYDPPHLGELELKDGTWVGCRLMNSDWPYIRVEYEGKLFWMNGHHVRLRNTATPSAVTTADAKT